MYIYLGFVLVLLVGIGIGQFSVFKFLTQRQIIRVFGWQFSGSKIRPLPPENIYG